MDAYNPNSEIKRRPSKDVVLKRLFDLADSDNIAEDLEDEELTTLGLKVCEEFAIDERSREGWETTAKKAMDVALQIKEAKNYPFDKASNVKWPLITVAALQFNARSYPEICSETGIVKAKVIGSDKGEPEIDQATGQPAVNQETGEPVWKVEPGAKAEKATRISEHMSYQLAEEMDGWEDDVDTLLMQLPIVGDVVKKVHRDEDGNVSEMIPAIDFVVNQATKSLKKCPRMTHRFRLYPFQIEERKNDGRYLDRDLSSPDDASGDEDAPHVFLEQHRRIDLDKDGYGEPYIVTVHKESETVVRIVANYEADDVVANEKRVIRITPREYFVNFVFIPDPEGGFYGIGFGRLLESLGAAIDTTINQMLDAGHLQNSGGGFIGAGVRLKKNVLRMEPGVYHNVQASGDNLRNAIVNMEHPGPSAVLFNLLGLMIDAAKDITAVKDILTGDSPPNETATTTLARIEQGMKVFTAIYKRIYRSLKQEFKLLFRLNAQYLDDQAYYAVMDTQKAVARADYDAANYDVCPQADPRLVTDMQRLKRAEALLATVQLNPAGMPEILRRYYTAIGAEDVEALMPPQQPNPMEELQVEGAVATVEKTGAEAELTHAKTAEIMAGIEHKGPELALKGLQAVDQMQQADDGSNTEKTSMVLAEARAEKDREAKKVKEKA